MMTKKEMFVAIREAMSTNAEVVEFCNHEIELIDKRSSSRSTKPSKAKLENDVKREQILAFLADNPKATCAQIADCTGSTLHSATGLLTTLRKAHLVKREYDKKTPVYSLGDESEAETA